MMNTMLSYLFGLVGHVVLVQRLGRCWQGCCNCRLVWVPRKSCAVPSADFVEDREGIVPRRLGVEPGTAEEAAAAAVGTVGWSTPPQSVEWIGEVRALLVHPGFQGIEDSESLVRRLLELPEVPGTTGAPELDLRERTPVVGGFRKYFDQFLDARARMWVY